MEIVISGDEALEVDFKEKPQEVSRALVRALNRGINAGRTFMVQNIAKDTGLKSGDVREAMRMKEATLSNPTATLGTSLKRIPLIKFGAKQTRRGVSYNLGGRKVIPGSFLATMGSGHQGVFTRKPGPGRRGPRPMRSQLPIVELFGPSLGHVFAKFRAGGLQRAQQVFVERFDSELKFASGAAGGGDASG
jgi:hypothetical protein